MITAAALIRMSMQDLGVLGAGESAEGVQMADGLQRLRMMVASWSLDALTVVRVQGERFDIESGKHIYSIGPGLDFDTPRPVGQQSIVAAGRVLNAGQPNETEQQVAMLTYDQYIGIQIKTLRSSLFTSVLYVPGASAQLPIPPPPPGTNAFGSGVIILWPVPIETTPIVLYIQHTIPLFENLTTQYPVPDGIAAAMQYNLTLAIAPMFQVTPSDEAKRMAVSTFAAMKRTNYQMTDVAIDPIFTMQGHGAGYNINTGSTQRHG
jgi:hypothetical protein